MLEPLNRPVVATYHGKRFTLTPTQARVGVDIDGSVAQALHRSRSGNIFARTSRNLRGTSLNEDVDLAISYNRAAIRQAGQAHQHQARQAGDRRARQPRGGRHHAAAVGRRPGRPHREPAVRSCGARCSRPTAHARVRVRTKVVKPKVTTDELAEKYPAVVIVNRGAFKLTLYKNLKPVKSYGIAVGAVGLETPAGLYHVQNKAVNPAWTMPNSDWVAPGDRGKVVPGGTPQNPLKARWLGIYAGAGIHGTDAEGSIGTAASHGCIRMRIPDVIELYPQVPVNAPVYIA